MVTIPPHDPAGPQWGGTERRRTNPQLDAAMVEIRNLYGLTDTMASALQKAAPRQEIEEAAKARAQRQMIITGVATGVHFLLMLIAFSWIVGGIEDRIHTQVESDHGEIACLEVIAEATKVAAPQETRITCRSAQQD